MFQIFRQRYHHEAVRLRTIEHQVQILSDLHVVHISKSCHTLCVHLTLQLFRIHRITWRCEAISPNTFVNTDSGYFPEHVSLNSVSSLHDYCRKTLSIIVCVTSRFLLHVSFIWQLRYRDWFHFYLFLFSFFYFILDSFNTDFDNDSYKIVSRIIHCSTIRFKNVKLEKRLFWSCCWSFISRTPYHDFRIHTPRKRSTGISRISQTDSQKHVHENSLSLVLLATRTYRLYLILSSKIYWFIEVPPNYDYSSRRNEFSFLPFFWRRHVRSLVYFAMELSIAS